MNRHKNNKKPVFTVCTGSATKTKTTRKRRSEILRDSNLLLLDEILSLTVTTAAGNPMSKAPSTSVPNTRSANRRKCSQANQDLGASPHLSNRKRKIEADPSPFEPAAKKMPEHEILAAINGLKTSIDKMEERVGASVTKEDLGKAVDKFQAGLDRNGARIVSLFDLRRQDNDAMIKTVEKVVDDRLKTQKEKIQLTLSGRMLGQTGSGKQDNDFHLARRSIRIWPVDPTPDIESGVKQFLHTQLKIPFEVLDNIQFEHLSKQEQPRRSKITDEILVRFPSAHTRDVIQSYAANLAEVNGKAGLRMEIPDHLRRTFRQFEVHAAALREKYGVVKRSVRFDDAAGSLCMDIKLESTGWLRISAREIEEIDQIRTHRYNIQSQSRTQGEAGEERRKVFMLPNASSLSNNQIFHTPISGVPVIGLDEEEEPSASNNN